MQRFGRRRCNRADHGINVTPLVDITLVLLIIFMVTARVLGSPVVTLDLPTATPSKADLHEILSIVMASNGRIQVDSQPVPNEDAILPIAREAHTRNPGLRAVIKADSRVTHGHVIHVLDLLRQAELTKIAFGVTPTPPLSSPLPEASGSGAPTARPSK